jgi:hypothetical protein
MRFSNIKERSGYTINFKILAGLTRSDMINTVQTTAASQAGTRDVAHDQEAVLQTLHTACKAYLEGNTDQLVELLSEDFTLTNAQGEVTTRADDIEQLRNGTIRYQVFENREMLVRLYGDSAIVTGRTIVQGIASNQTFAAEFQFTDTLVRQYTRWQLVASHISRIV